MTQEAVFGPPILPQVNAPTDRPLAVALLLDISSSAYGNKRIADIFKSALTSCFAKMEFDNVLAFNGTIYENPGTAVAAIKTYRQPVRNFSHLLTQSVASLVELDRFHRRRLVVVSDQFAASDVATVQSAIDRNSNVFMTDISFVGVFYGPKYDRQALNCSWEDAREVGDLSGLEVVLNEVCR